MGDGIRPEMVEMVEADESDESESVGVAVRRGTKRWGGRFGGSPPVPPVAPTAEMKGG